MYSTYSNNLLSIKEALDRIELALPSPIIGEIIADRDDPAWELSSMDGAAMRSIDGLNTRSILGTAYAGDPQNKFQLTRNSCVKVMTGACIPTGADTVVPTENLTTDLNNFLIPKSSPTPKAYIRYRGSQAKAGETLLAPQIPHNSVRIGLRSQVGLIIPPMHRIAIGIATTGDEIAHKPKSYQIRDANGPMLSALAHTMGANVHKLSTLPDDYEKLKLFFARQRSLDIVITSGGASIGEKDYLLKVLIGMGATILFHGINIKPGKPTVAAMLGKQLILGLPGNPMSSYVSALMLLPTAIAKLLGAALKDPWKTGIINSCVDNPYNRPLLQPCYIKNNVLTLIETKGSADLVSLAKADVLALIPKDGLTNGLVAYIEII